MMQVALAPLLLPAATAQAQDAVPHEIGVVYYAEGSGFKALTQEAAQQSGKTQEEIGIAMGYSKSGARQAVSRLLNSNTEYDPRLTTLIQFVAAINCSLSDIVS